MSAPHKLTSPSDEGRDTSGRVQVNMPPVTATAPGSHAWLEGDSTKQMDDDEALRRDSNIAGQADTFTEQPMLADLRAPPASSGIDVGKDLGSRQTQESVSNAVTGEQASEGVKPHPETQEIIRQVEFYFGDENLPQDAHLLSRTGEFGDGWVSLSEILGFKKMRRFKPASRVKASLHQSEKLEVWRDKFIRRKDPLTVPLLVEPKVDASKERNKILVENPWMTANMLKPTGFEEHATDGPIRPEEHEEEKRLFDPEESFIVRIENAIAHYCTRRKKHTGTANILTKFLMFGGFTSGQRQFVGGLSKKDLEEFDKEQIMQMTAPFAVSEAVLDGYDPEFGKGSWIIDFEGMAKAFLSSSFMATFDWKNPVTHLECTNVLQNFYNYLLLHDVCPEYEIQIRAAKDVCNLAEVEYAQLARLDDALPGSFNVACSILHGGLYADMRPENPHAEWVLEEDRPQLSDKDARVVFAAGVSAHFSKEKLDKMTVLMQSNENLECDPGDRIGLQVERIEHMSDQARQVYGHDRICNTFIKPTGKLHCVYWKHPHAPPKDVSDSRTAELKARCGQEYEFIMEEDILQNCFPGLKFMAVVKKSQVDTMWIDSVEYVYPSFFTWTLNEHVRDWKEPGSPTAWQKRQINRKTESVEEEDRSSSKAEIVEESKTDRVP